MVTFARTDPRPDSTGRTLRTLGPCFSGVVESACKTLVTQRMKNSGMRWGQEGGQAILTARSWCQSDRFDCAWATVAATYKTDVSVIAPVIELHDRYEKIGNFTSV